MSLPTQPIASPDEDSSFSAASEQTEEAKPWGKLVCISKNSPNLELKGKALFTLGRGSACDFIFKDQGVSGTHCKIWKDLVTVKGKQTSLIWIQDCRYDQFTSSLLKKSSTNGTRLDKEKLGNGTKKVLSPGSTVDLLWIKKDHGK